jgi:hypothetical protein
MWAWRGNARVWSLIAAAIACAACGRRPLAVAAEDSEDLVPGLIDVELKGVMPDHRRALALLGEVLSDEQVQEGELADLPFGAFPDELLVLRTEPSRVAAVLAALRGRADIAAASLLAWAGYSALLPLALALVARAVSRRGPFQGPLGGLPAGLAFGWAALLLHAALVRSVHLPWLPALLVPVWLAGNAAVAWFAGRGLLAREALR